jgi:hypothetical protein
VNVETNMKVNMNTRNESQSRTGLSSSQPNEALTGEEQGEERKGKEKKFVWSKNKWRCAS